MLKCSASGEQLKLGRLGRHGFFGELAVLGRAPQPYSQMHGIVCGICQKDVMTAPCGVDVSLEDDDEDDDYDNTVYPGTTIDELAAAVSAPVAASGWT